MSPQKLSSTSFLVVLESKGQIMFLVKFVVALKLLLSPAYKLRLLTFQELQLGTQTRQSAPSLLVVILGAVA